MHLVHSTTTAGGSLGVPRQPELHNKTQYPKQKQKTKNTSENCFNLK